jgi:hypothetical protein
MSYNGSGTFQINTSGQPVVAGTVISSTAFNALTADLATGLSTAITKDGQTTTTARIPFAAGINSSSATDSTSTSTGSIITSGGVGIAKNLYVGVNANVAGTLGVTGVATFSATPIYSSLTASSAVATDASKALVSVTNTGTGNNVLATSPTLVTPILGTPQSGTLTNATGLPLSTGVTGILPEANGGTGTTTGYYGFKNRLINSAMVIDQRNAGAVISSLGAVTTYIVDRFFYQSGNAGRFSAQQNAGTVTPPAGFTKYLGFTSLGANSPAASDYGIASQAIEGLNITDLGWGTASAATITISFWVRSSITGTQSIALVNVASVRSYSQTYTINSANTWEQKTITVPGDTSGTWATDNTTGIYLRFPLATGSNNLTTAGVWNATNSNGATGTTAISATSGATFYITGVQLEKGSTATSFDYRPYGTELALCQRYYETYSNGTGTGAIYEGITGSFATTAAFRGFVPFKVTKRASPTLVVPTTYTTINWSGGNITPSAGGSNFSSTEGASINFTTSTVTAGQAATAGISSSAPVTISAEL